VTVLRAAMIIGSGSASFEIVRYLVHRLPLTITPKWVSTPCQPIAVENVLTYLAGVLDTPETTGGVFDIGGRETLCCRDIICIMAEELRLPRHRIIPVPIVSPRLSSYWIHLVTPLSNRIARPLDGASHSTEITRRSRSYSCRAQSVGIAAGGNKLVDGRPHAGRSRLVGRDGFPRYPRSCHRRSRVGGLSRRVPRGRREWMVCRQALENSRSGSTVWQADPGRRHPDTLRYGDALDFWRVVGFERDRCLSLRVEIRLPGEVLLDFRVEANGEDRCTLHQTALFEPRGLFGLMYWYAALPFHGLVFRGMPAGIQRDAVQIAALERLLPSGALHGRHGP
jgi:Protein of unknown function (DUF2867)